MWSLDLPQPVWLQASLGHITGLWSTFLGGEDRGASHYICQKGNSPNDDFLQVTLVPCTKVREHVYRK